ncbi:MAG TPA: redox-regulated ATPase YchF, partial [Puia sp.]|nr:redox-regulated ATPase YchF [Puia sp.]
IEIVDIAGLVKGASKGEGLGNKFLANIREVDAIVHVIRCFEDENILRDEGAINPVSDKEIIDTELQLKDLESVEKKLQRTEKMLRTGDAKTKAEFETLKKCYGHLERGKNIRELALSKEDKTAIADLFLLTDKPVLYVANVDEASMHTGNAFSEALNKAVANENAQVIVMNNSIEAQIAEMDNAEDRQLFMEEYKMTEPALNKLIRTSYVLLNLLTYFTAGVQEVRAWTIHEGWKAPQAASVIHTDFEKGFIKAEVIAYNDFIQYGSEAACRENGKLRIEGKEYVVKDGDVMHFRFNV